MTYLLWSFLILATGLIDIGSQEADFDEALFRILHQAGKRLERAAEQRPFKIAGMNDSLAATLRALHAMTTTRDSSTILQELEQAEKAYRDNYFAVLLEAMVFDAEKNTQKANALFEQFLVKSRTYNDFYARFLDWPEFHRLRRIVYELLQSRGVTFEGREKEIQVVIPFEEFMKYLVDPKGQDFVMSVTFVVLLVGGAVLFVLAGFSSFVFIGPFTSNLPLLYLIVWLAYAVWMIDLAVGLPFQWSRHAVVPILLGTGLVLSLVSGLAEWWNQKNIPLEEGYRRCPHCKAVILQLSVQCSDCGRGIKNLA